MFVADNGIINIGGGNDLKLFHQSSNNWSYIQELGSGHLAIAVDDFYIYNSNATEVKASFATNGAVKLAYDNSYKFETTSSGVSVTGAITASQGGTITGNTKFNGAVDIGDDNGSNYHRVRLGASQDLSLWHDATNSYISNTTGDLFIQTAASKAVYIRPNNGANGIICHPGGAVDLYHNANKKLETSSTGVTVTGTVAATAFTGDGSG